MAREGFLALGQPYTAATIANEVERIKRIYDFADGGRVKQQHGVRWMILSYHQIQTKPVNRYQPKPNKTTR